MILLNDVQYVSDLGRPWVPVEHWEQVMADHAFRPMPGTVVLVQQPPVNQSKSGILLADAEMVSDDVTGRRTYYDWKETDGCTVVAVGPDPREYFERKDIKRYPIQYTHHAANQRIEKWEHHEFKVGDRVLANRMHGIGFREFFIDTPGDAMFYAQRLRIMGRAAFIQDDHVAFTKPYIVPLCRSMPAIYDEKLGKWRPTGDNVYIWRGQMESDGDRAVILPDHVKRRDPVGVVLDVPDKFRDILEPGDEILYQFDCQTLISTPELPKGTAAIPIDAIVSKLGKRDLAPIFEGLRGK